MRVFSSLQRTPYLCKMTIFGDRPRLISDITVEITQTCGLAAFPGTAEDIQGDNSGQLRNAAGEDGQHSIHNQKPLTVRQSNLHAQPSQDLFLALWIVEMLLFIRGKYL